jgi:tRNA U34 5-methylaminomethyl-2-thiouridine-forming methyltransferase MnmC
MEGLNRTLQLTDDGSHTMAIPELRITYHSTFGAIQESLNVYIQPGLLRAMNNYTGPGLLPSVNNGHFAVLEVFEMGFGTGLNALLTLQEAIRRHWPVRYQTVELHPLSEEEAGRLNYTRRLRDGGLDALFPLLHSSPWNEDMAIHPLFTLNKVKASINSVTLNGPFHVIFYDAFAPDIQPDLWERGIYEKLYRSLYPGGLLVTYCSKGAVRRGLQAAGFTVEKLPGPRGKREILRGVKGQEK